MKNIVMIGGTGLLGSEAAKELISKGYKVKTLSLSPLPKGAVFPEGLEIVFGNYMEMSKEELKEFFKGSEGFIFAAGVDDRVECKTDPYEFFTKYNVKPLELMLDICEEVGIKNAVVLGSYFSYFNRKYPELNLTKHHPYIKVRVEQEKLAFSHKNMNVSVIEIPYVFGTQPGRKPVWTLYIDVILKQKDVTYFMGGGTTMVTAHQTGVAIANALIKNKGQNPYPLGFYNMQYDKMLTIMQEEIGIHRDVISLPQEVVRQNNMQAKKTMEQYNLKSGLDLDVVDNLFTKNLYIEKEEGASFLEVPEDDIVQAIKDSARLSYDVLKETDPNRYVGMKLE